MSLEALDCTISKVIYHEVSKGSRSGNKFLIARTSAGVTVKGEMGKVFEGERYRLWGTYQLQKPYRGKPAEEAFCFDHHEVIIDQSDSGIAHYLRTYVDGLGVAKSNALVAEFGSDTLTILRTEPDKALEVKGITPEIVESVRKHFAETHIDPQAYARLIDMFAGYKIPKRIINTLIKDFGSDAPRVVSEKPYLLLAFPGLGWKIVDSFATVTAGYPADGVERHKAAIVEALERIASQGHTYGTRVDVESIAFQLINMRPTEAAFHAAFDEHLVYLKNAEDYGESGPSIYALPKLAEAETYIAERLATLAATATPLPFSLPDDGLLAGQMDALRLIEQHGVVIVAGAPGTGKTYTVTMTLTGLIGHGMRSIKYVAPTGKAAKRAAELLQRALPSCTIEPTTIHKALGPVPSKEAEGVPKSEAKMGRGREEFGFRHGPDAPIEAEIIVADEASMIDVKLGSSLFRAVANGTRLIIVGDPNQLPSVGPGSVLRDLIAAGVPTATLTEIQRNSGRIVRACHAILGGETPKPSPKLDLEADENWIHLEASEPEQIAQTIVALHESARKNGRYDPTWDMQVISPEKGKPGIGCEDLNRRLSDLINPYKALNPARINEDETGRRPDFEQGDKVIRTKNGLCDQMVPLDQCPDQEGAVFRWEGVRYGLKETDIVNGDMGIVRDIHKETDNWYVIVQFRTPDRLCRLPYSDSHLSQAYAVTCHKAQGSGFPYVIVPVHDSFYFNARTGEGLWNREMIYTLFSRAEKILVTVGQAHAIRAAVGRPTVQRRKTRLRALVERSMTAPAASPEPEEELVSVETR